MVLTVEEALSRGTLRTNQILGHLGACRSSYFRWKKEELWKQATGGPTHLVQSFEILAQEKQAVLKYALEHPRIRHRELAWRMIDEDVACLSMSTVYRVLQENDLMCVRPGRRKRYRQEIEKASRPDEIWGTDLMYFKIQGVQQYLLNFIDEYSRYLVHWELLTSMDGHTISIAAQKALEGLLRDDQGKTKVQPIICSDNGSG